MADLSLDEIIRKRGIQVKGRTGPRPTNVNLRARLGDTVPAPYSGRVNQGPPGVWPLLSRPFDARARLGTSDVRPQPLLVRDARERLGSAKIVDARAKLTNKPPTQRVMDARQKLLSARRGLGGPVAGPVVGSAPARVDNRMADARLKLSGSRNGVAAPAQNFAAVTPQFTQGAAPVFRHGLGLSKTIMKSGPGIKPQTGQQASTGVPPRPGYMSGPGPTSGQGYMSEPAMHYKNLYMPGQQYLDKPVVTSGQGYTSRPGANTGQEYLAKPTMMSGQGSAPRPGMTTTKIGLTRTIGMNVNRPMQSEPPQNEYNMEDEAYTDPNMKMAAINKRAADEKAASSTGPSPLEGVKLTVENLHPEVSEEDIVELFSAYGALKRARLVQVGIAEVVYVRKDDAITAYEKYNNRYLDGQPMKCQLHLSKHDQQPNSALKRLSDGPSTASYMQQTAWRQESKRAASTTELDPDVIQWALFKSTSSKANTFRPTAFNIKI
ncbi:polymerase delta-interacting protein 3 isoform X2 [Petromyzon marinus]|uniref:polymerase delta-interacting protein 3 isoform X2 n=1 Tax=Petromyzon marinus TaxID=7757 RepID=UPI003F6E520F